MEAYDLAGEEAFAFELNIEALMKQLSGTRRFEPFAKFPAVYRDISLIVDRGVESAEIRKIIDQEGNGLVESVRIFDLYEGEGIDPSEKALGFNICYRSQSGTLEGEDINRLHESIIEKIRQRTGGRLREG
jgi:phenylalanyl-tRNA synthetase beta chain